jgi:vacuolar-type H+-ATPase subunit I/STV1
MSLISLFISKDYAWEIMNELGKINLLHFIDLSKKSQVYNKSFLNRIKQCDEAYRNIKYSTF